MIYCAALSSHTDFTAWQDSARALCAARTAPEAISWRGPDDPVSLFEDMGLPLAQCPAPTREVKAPKAFIEMARRVICHRDPERFSRLYRILYRLQDNPALIKNQVDTDIIWLSECDKAIRRDRHKMHAFIRFRKIAESGAAREQFAAWFEPTHRIITLGAPFFMRRFAHMDWAIFTPDGSAYWDGLDLTYGAGANRDAVPSEDAVEEQWKTYFASIFNPARLKIGAMQAEMPKKYWKNLPEAALIPDLIAGAQRRSRAMHHSLGAPNPLARTLKAREGVTGPVTAPQTLPQLGEALQGCTRCPLYRDASQPVCGVGPARADLMIVGEQPGDAEDVAGKPFIGPAGQVLDAALGAAGIDRAHSYMTNAVKHFKYEVKGGKRVHRSPDNGDIDHCRWWLDTERKIVKPKVILALGNSALRGLTGKSLKVSAYRGQTLPARDGSVIIPTFHPAYLLRLPNRDDAQKASRDFHQDFKFAASSLQAAQVKAELQI